MSASNGDGARSLHSPPQRRPVHTEVLRDLCDAVAVVACRLNRGVEISTTEDLGKVRPQIPGTDVGLDVVQRPVGFE